MSQTEIIHAYRHLYRRLLRAVQFTSPERYQVRDRLRRAFREPGATLDREGVKRTVWFLDAAARETGLEHRILRNLIRMQVAREPRRQQWLAIAQKMQQQGKVKTGASQIDEYVDRTRYRHYDMTVAMLNKTMGLCLR